MSLSLSYDGFWEYNEKELTIFSIIVIFPQLWHNYALFWDNVPYVGILCLMYHELNSSFCL